jgi:hypothetical protein
LTWKISLVLVGDPGERGKGRRTCESHGGEIAAENLIAIGKNNSRLGEFGRTVVVQERKTIIYFP